MLNNLRNYMNKIWSYFALDFQYGAQMKSQHTDEFRIWTLITVWCGNVVQVKFLMKSYEKAYLEIHPNGTTEAWVQQKLLIVYILLAAVWSK